MEQAMILFAQKEKRILKMKEEVSRLGITPKLAVVVCDGYDQSSTRYVNNKKKIASALLSFFLILKSICLFSLSHFFVLQKSRNYCLEIYIIF